MPRAAPRPCRAPGCPAVTSGRYCQAHQHLEVKAEEARLKSVRKRFDARRGSSAARGYGRRHRRLRALVLTEQPICAMCARAWSTDLDHIDGDNRNTARENLQGLCKSCHGKKTRRQHLSTPAGNA